MVQIRPLQHLSGASLATRILAAIRRVVGTEERIALHEPSFGGREWQYLKECLDSGWVSTAGEQIKAFEADLCATTGSRHAVAVVNGTAALHLCLLAAGVQRDDEVIVPALTFVATANAVAYCGAIPHFADIDLQTLGLAPEALRSYLGSIAIASTDGARNRVTGRRLRAIMPMHTFGHPADVSALRTVAGEFGMVLIEDAAEALGSKRAGRHVGRDGLLSSLSFNGNKIVTTGGGGAVLCDDDGLAARVRHLSTTARLARGWSFEHDEVGYNYRMPNLNAALGRAQLEQLPAFIAAKRALAERYASAFADIREVEVFREPRDTQSNYWLNAILLSRSCAAERDPILLTTNQAGVETRPVWTLMHRLAAFRDSPRMQLPVAEDVESRLINLPSSAHLAGIAGKSAQ